jgi:outer membrane protein OmpA-like peptidoglycan-associated protein
MSGNSLARHCSKCDRQVHNISRMTEAQAGALLLRSGSQRLCVRFQHNGAEILFEPAQALPAKLPSRSAATMFAAAAIGVAACSPAPAQSPSGSVEPRDAARATPVTSETSYDRAPPAVATETDAGVTVRESCAPAERAQSARRVVVVEATQGIVILRMVQFSRGDHALDATNREIVEHVAKVLRDNPKITKIAIIGHASADERDAVKLSRLRAQQVLQALVALKIEPARLVAEAHGSKEPLVDNSTRQGRAKNRRIEFKVLSETP